MLPQHPCALKWVHLHHLKCAISIFLVGFLQGYGLVRSLGGHGFESHLRLFFGGGEGGGASFITT